MHLSQTGLLGSDLLMQPTLGSWAVPSAGLCSVQLAMYHRGWVGGNYN